jgi:hypothetical protein
MTLESYLQLVFQLGTAVGFTMLIFALVSVVCFYSYKTAETLIRKRHIYARRLKKSHAFRVFNSPEKLAVVKKRIAK